MHLEVSRASGSCVYAYVSILVSIWMHLEEKVYGRLRHYRYVSILVSIWMHLEVDKLQMCTVYNA